MSRSPRRDAPGMLHHVMVRGFEGWALFRDDLGGSRRRAVAHARAAASALAMAHLGLPAAVVARTLSVTPAVVLRGVQRGPDLFAARRLDPRRVCTDIMEIV